MHIFERILNGDFELVDALILTNKRNLIEKIKKSRDRDMYIYSLLSYHNKDFIYELIYDNPIFSKDAFLLIKENNELLENRDFEELSDSLKDLVVSNINELDIILDSTFEKIILRYLGNSFTLDEIYKYSKKYFARILIVILNNNFNIDEETLKKSIVLIMQDEILEDELSSIAALILDKTGNYHIYNLLKTYIMETYLENSLGKYLLRCKSEGLIELKNNLDEYFVSSLNSRFLLYRRMGNYLSKDIKDDFKKDFGLFLNHPEDFGALERLFVYNMEKDIVRCVRKYLFLSKNKTCERIGSGVTSKVYRIGDYVLKLVQLKIEKEDCPNLYLIVKNEEELYVRDDTGNIKAGIEVQRYVSPIAFSIDQRLIDSFTESLSDEGYLLDDPLVKKRSNEVNAGVLSSYLDADTDNFDDLPDWFKKDPIVLLDRDCVRKK